MKKKKAKALKFGVDKNISKDIKVYLCPRCKRYVTIDCDDYIPNYCSDCGQKLKKPKKKKEDGFRNATIEEKESVNKYINSISEDTGEVF